LPDETEEKKNERSDSTRYREIALIVTAIGLQKSRIRIRIKSVEEEVKDEDETMKKRTIEGLRSRTRGEKIVGADKEKQEEEEEGAVDEAADRNEEVQVNEKYVELQE